MKKLFKKVSVLLIGSLLVTVANASLIGPDQIDSTGGSPSGEITDILNSNSSLSSPGNPLTYLAKVGGGGGWDGSAPYGDDKFDYTPFVATKPATAQVAWDLTGTGWELWAVVVKTGSKYLNLYTVSATNVDYQRITNGAGTETVEAPDNKDSISHISFFGRRSTSVPESGSTLILLGLGLSFLAFLKRKK